MWTTLHDGIEFSEIRQYARGSYQRGILAGHENLSGSTLRGRAASYGRLYKISRENLLARLRAAGFQVWEERDHGRRLLNIGR